nr:RecName: Full=76 kDa cell wall protein [Solanum lycopersicum]
STRTPEFLGLDNQCGVWA